MNTDIVPLDVPEPVVVSGQEIRDRMERYELVARIARAMASAPLIPEHLRGLREGKGEFKPFDPDAVFGNCFMVANQALNWRMDPFAVAQATAVVHGRLCYEGKLVAAAVRTLLGVELVYEWFGAPGTDGYGIRITHPDDPMKMIVGTVADWRTTDRDKNVNLAWRGSNQTRQLKYRGDREWCRLWAPELILGVYTPDEMLPEYAEDVRARRAAPVEPAGDGLRERLAIGRSVAPTVGAVGFTSPEAIVAELDAARADDTSLRAAPTPAEATSSPPKASQSRPSAAEAIAQDAPSADQPFPLVRRYVLALKTASDRETLEKAHRAFRTQIDEEFPGDHGHYRAILLACQSRLEGKIDDRERDDRIAAAAAALGWVI